MAFPNSFMEPMEELSTNMWLYIAAFTGILTWGTYNLYFHSLAAFPGPFLARASLVYYSISTLNGKLATNVRFLHDKYGDVVRIAPNILSFNSGQAWEDIYGRGLHGAYDFMKDRGRELRMPNSPPSLGFADEKNHRRYRRILSHAFSEKAILEHEPLVMKVINSLLDSLHTLACSSRQGCIDIEKSMTAVMFDISTELSFGESLGVVASRDRSHPWMNGVKSALKDVSTYCAVRRLIPHALWCYLDRMMLRLSAKSIVNAFAFSKQAVQKRLKSAVGHKDFMAYLIDALDTPDGLNRHEVERLALTLVNAGSDTTATLLCHTVYRLAKHRDVLQELLQQIQEVASSPSEINFTSIKRMPYLTAVIEESLRMFPPALNLFPRVVPRGGAEICGHFVPGGSSVCVSQLSQNLSSQNFVSSTDFVPSRWLGGDEFQSDNRKARKPFGYGPRNCAGQNTAYMHSKIIIARIVLDFDITLEPESLDWPQKCKAYDLIERTSLYVKLWPRLKSQGEKTASESLH